MDCPGPEGRVVGQGRRRSRPMRRPGPAPLFGYRAAARSGPAATGPLRGTSRRRRRPSGCSPSAGGGHHGAARWRRCFGASEVRCSSRCSSRATIGGPSSRPARRSVAFRLTFRAPDRTLRDPEVDAIEARMLAGAGNRARDPAPRCGCGRGRRVSVTYYYERPDQKAMSDLEQLVRHLAEELAGWRRRTLKAEGELQEIRANGGVLAGPELNQSRQRVIELEMENQALADTGSMAPRSGSGRWPAGSRFSSSMAEAQPREHHQERGPSLHRRRGVYRPIRSCRPSTPVKWPRISTRP